MSFSNFIKINYGRWMTQKTVFITKTKHISLHKSEINIDKVDLPIETSQILNKEHKGKHLEKYYTIKDLNSKKLSNIMHNIEPSYANTINHISVSQEKGNLSTFEKIWLVNPNLRLGITLIKKYNRCVAICFSSDIRIS